MGLQSNNNSSNELDVGTFDKTKYQKLDLALANDRKSRIIVPTDINHKDVERLSKLLELTIIE